MVPLLAGMEARMQLWKGKAVLFATALCRAGISLHQGYAVIWIRCVFAGRIYDTDRFQCRHLPQLQPDERKYLGEFKTECKTHIHSGVHISRDRYLSGAINLCSICLDIRYTIFVLSPRY